MITSKNLINHELIGLDVTIVESTNRNLIGLSGKIIDETKSMFNIDTAKGSKLISKSHNNWKFDLDGSQVIVNGSSIARRSYERVGIKS